MIEKDRIVYTSDPRIIADIEDNSFHSPIPVIATGTGYWVPHWSMEQYRAALNEIPIPIQRD